MTYRTDGTEDAVVAGVNILLAQADSGNVIFCLDYLEKKNTFNGVNKTKITISTLQI